jgi:integrase
MSAHTTTKADGHERIPQRPDGGARPRRLRRCLVLGPVLKDLQAHVRRALPLELHGLRFHELRYTCASLLIARSVHAKPIQVRLGHATFPMTMDVYRHLLPSLDDALAATLDAMHEASCAPDSNFIPLRPADAVTEAR